jgi:hypothetical protein
MRLPVPEPDSGYQENPSGIVLEENLLLATEAKPPELRRGNRRYLNTFLPNYFTVVK